MTFEEYKKKYKLNNSQLAKLCKVSRECIYNWSKGKIKPHPSNALLVYKGTKGEITLEDMGVI